MRIERIRTLAGPNVYTYRPALLMRLDLEDLAERESRELSGFNERLLELLPGLREHTCGKGYRGGFVERLHEGTYFGHVVEHVAIELTTPAGAPVAHGKTRYAGTPGVYNVVVEYKAETATEYLLRAAVELVEALIRGEAYPLEEKLREARRLVARHELGPSTRAIVDAASRRNIPAFRLGTDSLVQLGYGKYRRFIQAAMCDGTSAVAVEIAGDKELTKKLLEQVSIPVPRGALVETEEEALAALRSLGAPVVVKPLDGRQGLGVSLNLSTPEEVLLGFRIAREYSRLVLVEELFEGRNYRVLVVGGEMVAASERTPCVVKGDGAHTIRELVDLANLDPMRGEGHEKPLTQIVVDEIMLAYLAKTGRGLDDVPEAGEVVYLRESINLSTGGTAKDVTDVVHPSIKDMCERAARVVGMDICGIDLVLPDISGPTGGGGGIIELNAAPGLRMHLFPSEGRARDVGAAIIEMLYPRGADGRVPVISITGTNGKTTVTRMIGHVLNESGLTTGVTTTDGIYIGGRCVAEGDTTGPQSARTVLSDPSVEVAVLETARGGIMRRGLGYDWSDIAVLTNIRPDHIGQDGIETLDDLVYIKSLVAERVRDGGTLVLNADDEEVARLLEIPRVREGEKRVVYFSAREDHLMIKRHLDEGGTAYFVRDGWVVEAEGPAQRRVLEVGSVPATMAGTAEYQVSNVLAAVAACRAQGVAVEQLAASLAGFRSAEHNPGRSNLFRIASGGYVMLDYGHNADAFAAICRMAAQWEGRRVTGIIGVPGDRDDALIEEAGRIAARGFHRLVIKEDEDARGRERGEVARLLCEAARREAPERECRIVLDDTEALSQELRQLRGGDVVVMFYDKLEPLLRVLEGFGARAATTIEGLETQAKGATASSGRPSAAPREETHALSPGNTRFGRRPEDAAGDLRRHAWH
ncbi:MAG TPA: cyanophycin synthetase [Pyrinomonadaceae bacterium]